MSSNNRPYNYELRNIHKGMQSRGPLIGICPQWNSFTVFYKDMLPEYSEKRKLYPEEVLSIDRIDPSGIYEPSNCRIIPMFTQASNKTNNHYVYIYNQRWTLAQAYNAFCIPGVTYNTFKNRILTGWDLLDALYTPVSEAYDSNYAYVHQPIMYIQTLEYLHKISQGLNYKDRDELFNYNPKNIEDIDKDSGRYKEQ